MNIYTIYRATNILNNKSYIGFDSNYPNRITVHKSASKKQDCKFYRAIRKHGWGSFQWEILYQSKDKDYTLKVMEKYFINEYDSFHKGYNSTLGGDGCFGQIMSEKARKIISEKNKISKPHTQEHIRKRTESRMKNFASGKTPIPKPSEETKRKISLSNKGKPKPVSEEHKKNLKYHDNNRIQISCPHCGKQGQLTNMKGKHIPYCKLNPNRKERPLVSCSVCGYTAKDTPNFRKYHNNNCKLYPPVPPICTE